MGKWFSLASIMAIYSLTEAHVWNAIESGDIVIHIPTNGDFFNLYTQYTNAKGMKFLQQLSLVAAAVDKEMENSIETLEEE